METESNNEQINTIENTSTPEPTPEHNEITPTPEVTPEPEETPTPQPEQTPLPEEVSSAPEPSQNNDTVSDSSPSETTVIYSTNTTLIEEKLDNIIALESQQTTNSLFCLGFVIAIFIVFLLYKFIANFFEF